MKKIITKTFLGLLFTGMLMSLYVNVRAQAGPGDWQLPSDYYISAKMPMTLVHPRNDDAADWAYAKNAHPGIRWEIPIVIQGGAWPFRYEIVNNGGASGLEIGGELERVLDDGFIVHNVTDEYGTLWWDNPVAGEYEILVRVHDQEANTTDVPISLTVGTAGWVFVDADNGDDSTGDGTQNAPFQTIQSIHDGGSDFADHRVYLSGVMAMDGNDNGHLVINPTSFPDTPAVWVGLPGSGAVLEAYEGRISLSSQDFYLANLEHRHHEDFYQDHGSYIHMITAWNNTDRLTMHDVNFSRFHGNPVNASWGNSSIIMFTDQDDERSHVAVVNNTISGDNGIFTSAYNLRHSVFEKNNAVEANFVTADPSVWSIFWMKRNNEYITFRANEFVENNTWGTPGNLEGVLGLDEARNVEFAYNTIHTTWVQSTSWRGGTIKLFTGASHPDYTWTEDTPVWLYRNSLRHRLFFGGGSKANMADGTVRIERNILDGNPNDFGTIPSHDRVLNIENLDGDTYFDSQMKLTGSARTFNLGRFGAEIAVEEGGSVNRPEASFTFEPDEDISVGTEVSFFDNSIEGDEPVTQWNWNFGDGTTSTDQNPVHTYMSPGTYTITLTVTDANNMASPPSTQPISVHPEFAITECENPEEDWVFCDDFEEDRLDQYYDFFQTWGRFQRHERGILGSRGMSSYYGHYSGDPAGDGYDTWMKLAFGKTPDESTFLPAGDPEVAEREINWRFYVISRTDNEEGNNSTGPLANVFAYGPEVNGVHIPFMKVEVSYPDQTGELESRLYTAEFDGSGQPVGTNLAHTLRGETPVMLPSVNATWHKIEIHVKLNTPGESNGEFELRIDDEVESSQAGLDWAGNYTDYGINAIEIRNTVNQLDAVSGNNSVNRTFDNMLLTGGTSGPVGEGSDQRILASNRSDYVFTRGDFGLEEGDEYSIQIESLPGEGSLLLGGTAVSPPAVVTTSQLSGGALSWSPPAGEHGVGYTSFGFQLVDASTGVVIPPPPPPPGSDPPPSGNGGESGQSYTLSIDLAAASVELTGEQGWRFLTSPATAETYGSLLDGIWTQGVPGSAQPGASSVNIMQFDQQTFWWDDIPGMDESIGQGQAFIAYVVSDDNNDGVDDGFPKTLTSLEQWNALDGSFAYSGLGYDGDPDSANPDNLYVVGNPHPVSIDFCQMYTEAAHIGSSIWIWNPGAGGGNGDYVNLNCATEQEVSIAPFQGFWVRTTDANPALGVPEEAYLGSTHQGLFKQQQELAEEDRLHLELTLDSRDGMFSNKVGILFSREGTPGLDPYDAPKLSAAGLAGQWLSFYALDEQGRSYAFRSLPREIEEQVRIPLHAESTRPAEYELSWSLPPQGAFGGSYWLRDNQTSAVTELVEGGIYRFEITPDDAADSSEQQTEVEPRFELLVAVGLDGPVSLGDLPDQIHLRQNYPNPFNPTTVIAYELPQAGEVRLEVYDITGRHVATLVDRQVAAGRHQVAFDASNLSSGVYLYRLQAGTTLLTRKLTVIK